VYENQHIEDLSSETSFVEFFVLEGDGTIETMSIPHLVSFEGLIILIINVKSGQGLGSSSSYIDEFSNIFNFKQLEFRNSGIINCQVTSSEVVGESKGWYRLKARCTYTRFLTE
jgi:hypothetical protein